MCEHSSADLIHFAITVIGKDRPGIVADTTEALYSMGCNIEDSSCTLLGGDFAMILVASHAEPFAPAQLLDELKALHGRTGLSAHVRLLEQDEIRRVAQEGDLCLVSIYGADRPGIVYRVTRELANRRITITDLNTRLVGSAEQPVYVMMLEAALPAGMAVEEVAVFLEELKTELCVEVGVRAITPVTL